MLTQDKLDEICADLQGTCMELEKVLGWHGFDYADLSKSDFDEIDRQVFLCEVCGWWVEVGDYAEDGREYTCSQCGDEEE
tara:strand:- start:2499 stop:2738 length:240 start_codon:yes stop_codon:yes gene_type:complete